MGKLLSKQTERPPQVVLMGLDGAGKSTLLSRLQWGEKMETSPTVGFNVGTLEVEKGVTLTVWDVGGQGEMRANWKYYLDDCQTLVFVVDGADRERLGEAQKALRRVLREEALKEVPLMVLVNKKDLPNSMTIREVSNLLDQILGSCRLSVLSTTGGSALFLLLLQTRMSTASLWSRPLNQSQ